MPVFQESLSVPPSRWRHQADATAGVVLCAVWPAAEAISGDRLWLGVLWLAVPLAGSVVVAVIGWTCRTLLGRRLPVGWWGVGAMISLIWAYLVPSIIQLRRLDPPAVGFVGAVGWATIALVPIVGVAAAWRRCSLPGAGVLP